MTNYRICRVNRTAYAPVFDRMYADDPELKHRPSDVQAQTFFDQFLVYSDSFSRGMQSLGNESSELLCNAEHIQKAWANENGVSYSEDGWIREIMLAQIEKLRPDVIYIQGISRDPTGFLPEGGFRAEHPFVKSVVAYSGVPHDVTRFDGVDEVICGVPQLVSYYADHGFLSHLVHHGFDDAVLARLDGAYHSENIDENIYDFCFTGLSGVGFRDGHRARYWDLVRLILNSNLESWIYDRLEYLSEETRMPAEAVRQLSAALRNGLGDVNAADIVQMLKEIFTQQFGNDDPKAPLTELFPDRCRDPIFGLDMFRLLKRAKVVFNRHTDALEGQFFGNIRIFEATGVGSCLLTDFSSSGESLFEPDHEIVTYASIDECIEKVRYLLDHESEREAIAKAGQERTLKSHTTHHRCEQIHEIIVNALN